MSSEDVTWWRQQTVKLPVSLNLSMHMPEKLLMEDLEGP